MADDIVLGYLPNEIRRADIHVCKDCGSENTEVVKKVSKPDAARFIANRASRLGLVVANHDIKVDKDSGKITATPKKVDEMEIDFD